MQHRSKTHVKIINSKPKELKYCEIAGEMAVRIKEIIYEYEDQIPLVLALGVLRVVEIELTNDHQ